MTGKDTADWAAVEAWVVAAFGNQRRKDGTSMAQHSINVGRIARQHPAADAVSVFGAYGHDLIEDTAVDEAQACAFALTVLHDEAAARAAAALVRECSYSDEEYGLAKPDRKAAACRRWLAAAQADIRVAVVKAADVADNDLSCAAVSQAFAADYRAWALPLKAELDAMLARAPAAVTR